MQKQQPQNIIIYDATLREGAQGPGASFTVEDKLKIVSMLDKMGVSYIEAGNPGSNIKDAIFYERMQNIPLKNAKLVAFGATCRVGVDPKDDANMQSLIAAKTPAVAIFGKSWDFHVTEILRCTLEQNLEIIKNSVAFLVENNCEVVFDAEHFFDGYKNNPEYAMQALHAAKNAGASWFGLCDTNGGCMPNEIYTITQKVANVFGNIIGIHCHNDTGVACANSIEAVRAGATMVQCTLNGWGERCGNADFFTIVPNLQLKLGYNCIDPSEIKNLKKISTQIYELVNKTPDKKAPYVGQNAFTHKAGMHIDAVNKNPVSFEHIDPKTVGQERIILVSEVAGRGALLKKVQVVLPQVQKDSPLLQTLVEQIKQRESEGYQFEGAEASFELMIRKAASLFHAFFNVEEFKVIATEPATSGHTATAMIRLTVGHEEEITAANGDGPVNALDLAVRKALERFYPTLKQMRLTDYKVRVLDSTSTTASKVRVIIESFDGTDSWSTVGVHNDILQASWKALIDSIEYKLVRDAKNLNL